ncbi:hypothetical protein ABBQ32_011252 [Trebouxia sp. C0010 RCD-2024]
MDLSVHREFRGACVGIAREPRNEMTCKLEGNGMQSPLPVGPSPEKHASSSWALQMVHSPKSPAAPPFLRCKAFVLNCCVTLCHGSRHLPNPTWVGSLFKGQTHIETSLADCTSRVSKVGPNTGHFGGGDES